MQDSENDTVALPVKNGHAPEAGSAPAGTGQLNGTHSGKKQSNKAPEESVHKLNGNYTEPENSNDNVKPVMGLARYLAWVFMVLVLGLSVFLSLMIGKSARNVMLEKQYAFASLLADNLNHQIYRRYSLPTLIGYGKIDLSAPAQYERLDQLIKQVIHGMNVQDLRIYGHSQTVSYATDPNYLGQTNVSSPAVVLAMTSTDPIFDLDYSVSKWQAFFRLKLEKNSIILRTTYPLRIENRLTSSQEDGPVMGVMVFRQDITKDMVNVMRFQWGIVGITLISCLLIFSILVFFLRRAERALDARVAERDRLQEKLHQHEKLAGMGRVIAGIAHEIRNPLGIICSSAELLLRRVKGLDDNSRNILQAVFDESTRLSKTVTDFLDYARPRAPNQTPVDMGKVTAQAVIFMQPELDRCNITAHWQEPDTAINALGDKDLLYRAIYNILGNAVQALSAKGSGGEIWINVGYYPQLVEYNDPVLPANSLRIPDTTEGGAAESTSLKAPAGAEYNTWARGYNIPRPEQEVLISIRDSGPGFDLEDTRNYIDPFFTTKPSGSGLGLAIVNSIIESHKGRLELKNFNGPKSGAVVNIYLPMAK
ncbi:two-component sensor histidine kinase [Desulfovibrio sp. OttesenSCG-928-F07]|nr:two-component sensor histidine kinase [Desulfovibrio sp. OttesenSCG-928-F07]